MPGAPELQLSHLDEAGLPRPGEILKAGDILVGIGRSTRKLTPGEAELGNLSLNHGGPADLWIDDSPRAEHDAGRVESVSVRPLQDLPSPTSVHPLRWLDLCAALPVGAVVEEIEIVLDQPRLGLAAAAAAE